MDHLDLVLSFTDYEWTLYSIHRLNYSQFLPQYITEELLRQISLENEFRSIVNELIDNW